MYLSAEAMSWTETTAFLGLLFALLFLLCIAVATWLEYRKLKVSKQLQDDLRQLVKRYEQLAENTMDAQQRIAADVSDLRARTAAIEQILRTVE
jgi:cell division protein FtsB